MRMHKAALISVECPAKINLTFEILGLLPDRYHEVRTLLAAVSLADELSFKITPAEQQRISLALQEKSTAGSAKTFPLGPENLIYKAIQLYLAANPQGENLLEIEVQVEKHIPIQAGLAGGSANAAAALVAMNTYAQSPLSQEILLELASKLGADVPFSLAGGLKLGTHRGDKLESLFDLPSNLPTVILAKPRHLTVSTPWAFSQYDQDKDKITLEQRCRDREITDNPSVWVSEKILANAWQEAIPALGNDFEQVILPAHPELVALRQKLKRLGALSCNLTGSGPTMYALCRNIEEAQAILQAYQAEEERDCPACQNKYDPVDFYATQIVNYGARARVLTQEQNVCSN